MVDWLLETASLREFLQHLVDDAVSTSGADGCGVTIQRSERPLTVVSTGGVADKLDEKQYGQDDGPCLQALRTGEAVHVPDLLVETRWGSYPRFAVDLGIRSSLSVPIPVRAHTAGALNFYAADRDAFGEDDRQTLALFAAQAGGGIALAQRLADAEDFTRDLQAALASRSVIDQAIGSVMQQQQCTAEEAFDLLRRLSQQTNLKLRDVCTRLLTGIAGQPPAPRSPLRPRP
ncbi:GAF and ANTAR domain-containing protein [Streptomyces sp. ISL-22]|uniref:GAF and ANTAR domain-containing protein n=1 Tax=unclassified Streptomyces TaxID=2593676 RepID=UPI001BE64ED6|nr:MULTISPECIES: GAF and ANTAR domain-containing protein [unclassified Streptomyces]MBT2424131.1 GAF and ANTAR domain-containing protein [Streptomyces sp. ISL-24]MBT2438526.1 GAF and ANTAR domain-containing protein [Streptomyces sp. ISL-22]